MAMVTTFRPISAHIATTPKSLAHREINYSDDASVPFIWFRLRQFVQVPDVGLALFSGTLAQRKALHRDFGAYLRQAQTYWDAGTKTAGSASALPYYYAALQLAKAELLQSNASEIQGKSIMHGLRRLGTTTSSIRSDYLEVTKGVFPLMYKKRTGRELPVGTRLRAINLLSLIPEIGLEMQAVGPSRPPSFAGYHALVMDSSRAWSVVLTHQDVTGDPREPIYKRFHSGYDEVPQNEFKNWRGIFALSSRMFGGNVRIFQSKMTASFTSDDGIQKPDSNSALRQLAELMGDHLRPPIRVRADFELTPSVKKSSALVLPLDLIRYAAMFYLSSLVRYAPAALDATLEGGQAYLMDSFTNEVPLNLLVGALGGITGAFSYFDPNGMRL